MARFYASIQGQRGEATRMGSAKSGMVGHVRGWDIGARVDLDDRNGKDVVTITLTGGSNGRTPSRILGEFVEGEPIPETIDAATFKAALYAVIDRTSDLTPSIVAEIMQELSTRAPQFADAVRGADHPNVPARGQMNRERYGDNCVACDTRHP